MQSTANADAVLKDYYLGPVREQLNQKAILLWGPSDGDEKSPSSTGDRVSWRGLSKESEGVEFAGRQWVIPVHVSRNEGVGAIDDLETAAVDAVLMRRRRYLRIRSDQDRNDDAGLSLNGFDP